VTPRPIESLRGTPELRDVERAVERARAHRTSDDAALRDFFSDAAPLLVARAPGRLDVMGGIADYSGSLVLQLPLACATTAVIQPTTDRAIELVSLRARGVARFGIGLDELLEGPLRDPERLRSVLARSPRDRWAAYVLGVVHACLVRGGNEGRAARGGFRLLVHSEVPEGKGVSSSAALEVACLAAVAARYEVAMPAEAIATASQWAENHVAGAPCGIMDQMTSACGRRDRLLRLRCQPDRVEGHVAVPEGFRFYGIDSGVRHAVTGSDYGTVRTAAFMGYRIIADAAGLPSTLNASNVREADTRWHGYLANVAPEEFESTYAARLPETMRGADFLARYDGITDTVTRVDPDRDYPVRVATAHPVYENARVERFAELLGALRAGDAERALAMGRLMGESHASYSACGLGSDATDRLVALAMEAGPERGVYGAKITGGGSGGTVAVLARDDAVDVVREIAEAGGEGEVIEGSSEGVLVVEG
jgi:L-arabinokinase